MSAADLGNDPLEPVAEEFLERFRRGERPALSEYKARFPDLADRIDDLFPALIEIERFGSAAAASDRTPELGPSLAQLGDYRLLREIGRGGMGIVYEAIQESLGRRVALKVLPKHARLLTNQLERFRREACAAARLHHTNIVPVFGVGECDGVHYYAMQFIAGLGVHVVLDELRRMRRVDSGLPNEAPVTGPAASAAARALLTGLVALPTTVADLGLADIASIHNDAIPRKAITPCDAGTSDSPTGRSGLSDSTAGGYMHGVARLGLQVAEALAYAHGRGVFHRDIKQSNLLLEADGTAWVTDFGLAKAEDGDDLTGTGDVVGTLRYMAPERFEGRSGPAGDIYALGATLYELLTLQPPFLATGRAQLIQQTLHQNPVPPRALDRIIPRDLETIVTTALAKDPSARYATAARMAEDLRRFLSDRPIRARRASAWERAWRWCRRNPVIAGLLAAVLALSVVITWGALIAAARQAEYAESLRWSLARVQNAERSERERLRDSLAAQARASRYSGLAGRRGRSLAALADAARIRPDSALRDEAIACLALVDLHPLREWDAHEPQSSGLALDPAFARYATADPAGDVHLRRVSDDALVARLPRDGPLARDTEPEFSPDGRYLAVVWHSWGRNDRTTVWNLSKQPPVLHFQADGRLTFSPDGRTAAVLRRDGFIELRDVASGVRTGEAGAGAPGGRLLFHPDGKSLVVSAPGDELALHWIEVASGAVKDTIRPPAEPKVLAWKGDGRLLALGCNYEPPIHLWDAETRRWRSPLLGHAADVRDLSFSPDGVLLASGGWDSETRLWDVERGREVVRLPGCACRFDRSGARLAYRSGRRAGLWELQGGREFRVLPYEAGAVDFSADGRLLAGLGNGAVHICDAVAGREVDRVATAVDVEESTAMFRPGSSELVTYTRRTGLCRWPRRGGPGESLQKPLFGPAEPFGGLAPGRWALARYSADGRWLAASESLRDRVHVLNAGQPDQPAMTQAVMRPTTVALSADGRWAAAAAWRTGIVRVWEPAGGRSKDLPASRSSFTHHVAFSPDGQWLIVGGADDFRFWHVGDWQPGLVLPRDRVASHAGALAFTRDGRTLAIAHTLHDVRLLDVATAKTLATLTAPQPGLIAGLAFSPDGTRLAVAVGKDGIQLWDLAAVGASLATLGLDREWPVTSRGRSQSGRAAIDPASQSTR